MAEYVYNEVQTVEAGQNVLLNDSIPCTKGLVIHRNGSGILTLRGPGSATCNRFARYQVVFNGNVAVPEGGTAGPISIALAINGEAVQTSRAIVTPTVAGAYFNVTSTAMVNIPNGCCENVAIENISGIEINVQNANLVISRVA